MFYQRAQGAAAINAAHESEQDTLYGNLSLTMDPKDIASHLEKHVAEVSAELSGKLKIYDIELLRHFGKIKNIPNQNIGTNCCLIKLLLACFFKTFF